MEDKTVRSAVPAAAETPAATGGTPAAGAGAGPAPATAAGPRRSRAALIAVVLAVGALLTVVAGLWTPVDGIGSGGEVTYNEVDRAGGAWLAWHLTDGIGTGLGLLGLALGVCVLVRGRGAHWATAGAVAAVLGGMLFAAGTVGFGLLGAYAVETGAMTAAAGGGLVDYVNDEGGAALVVVMPGFLLSTLGQLLLAVALWRSRAVPVWLPAAMVVGNVVLFLSPSEISGWVLAVLGLVYGFVAWHVWAARTTT